MHYSLPGSSVCRICQAKILEWVAIFLSEWVSEVAQSCLTLCDPVDCSLPSSSIHGILQARILEWVAISSSRGSSWPRDRTWVSRIGGRCFSLWATRKPLQFPYPGYIPDPGIEPTSSTLAGGFFTTEPPGKPNGILLSHRNEWIWVSWTEVDEPRACYTEWNKSEREK